jgi:hypothetical protein
VSFVCEGGDAWPRGENELNCSRNRAFGHMLLPKVFLARQCHPPAHAVQNNLLVAQVTDFPARRFDSAHAHTHTLPQASEGTPMDSGPAAAIKPGPAETRCAVIAHGDGGQESPVDVPQLTVADEDDAGDISVRFKNERLFFPLHRHQHPFFHVLARHCHCQNVYPTTSTNLLGHATCVSSTSTFCLF